MILSVESVISGMKNLCDSAFLSLKECDINWLILRYMLIM